MAEAANGKGNQDTQTVTEDDVAQAHRTYGKSVVSGLGYFAQKAWQAGLGAAIIGERKAASLLGVCIKEGESYQQRAADQLHGVKESAQQVKQKASGKIHRLEQKIDHGLDNTLHRFGVPTHTDFKQLNDLVNDLSVSVSELAIQLRESTGAAKPSRGRSKTQSKAQAS